MRTPSEGKARQSISSQWRTRSTPPSTKYAVDPEPNRVLLRQAAEPPHPTLPRKRLPQAFASATTSLREQFPLAASLTGRGRAGKVGELLNRNGLYKGPVLAGRPHGIGEFFIQKAGIAEWTLQFVGEWVNGVRTGEGTMYYPNGEVYTGAWEAGKRHGLGKMEYACGDYFEGMWENDARSGRGTYVHASGNIFVGNFVNNKKEGLGTVYMAQKRKMYTSDYVADTATWSTWSDLYEAHGDTPDSVRKAMLAFGGSNVTRVLPELHLKQAAKGIEEVLENAREARTASLKKTLRNKAGTDRS